SQSWFKQQQQQNNADNSHHNQYRHHQGDTSIAGGRCMIPAINLHQMGYLSTSASF
ncbi:hypothetical protein BGX23_009006, partial [Mortierella sp. AD031]